MNLIKGRLLAIAVAVVLVTANWLLEAAGLEYAFEDCAFAALSAMMVVVAADRRS
ncbi:MULTISPECIES: hypothetical protein [unclassified Methylobacterium]|uniref:hypothetical protein n=1 Tax=unclassified Methylobacterium TaxID=2615210 RepID=UPI00164F52A8|nr:MULTISPECIES: hypothetical protein [unclassified Methylobacterium]